MIFLQVLVPVRGHVQRAVHVEAGVHGGRVHDGRVLRGPRGHGLHPGHEEEDVPLRAQHADTRLEVRINAN